MNAALFPELVGKLRAMGSHQSHDADTHTWLTPPHIIEALGPFDLDPCAAPEPRPWPTARTHWNRQDNSLNRDWFGRVWLNPPYGNYVGHWMKRLAEHGCGTALIFARTETRVFFETVWERATAVRFFRGRLNFYRPDGTHPPDSKNAGAPSVLVAYGEADAERLRDCELPGQFLMIP